MKQTLSRIQKTGIAVAVTLAPLAVWAQPIVPPAPILSNDQPTERVIRIEGGASVERQNNLLSLPSGATPTAAYGQSSRSDTVWRGFLSASLNREISLQRLSAELRVDPTKYTNFSQFDNVGYLARANLDWAVGPAIFGTAGFRATQVLTSFLSRTYTAAVDNAGGSSKNLERRFTVYGSAGLRITPSWSAFIGIDRTALNNSAAYYQSADSTITGYEAGARYAPGTGNEFSLVARHVEGDFDNLQLFDALGNVLPTGVNNSYKQDQGLVRMRYAPSDDTRLTGEVGYTKRKYDTISQRDFSGPTAGLTLAWRPTGGFYMNVELAREIASYQYLTSNYIEVTELRLLPVVVLTGKIRLNGQFIVSDQRFKGDPGFSTGPLAMRKDTLYTYGAQVAYEFSRNLTFTGDVRQVRRNSNYDYYNSTNTIIGLGVRALVDF